MLLRSRAAEAGHRTLTFALRADHPAGRVSVVGNFNDWTPGAHLLVPDQDGWMAASVTLPDNYIAVFRYLGEGGWWFDEPDADFVDGGASVVLGEEDSDQVLELAPDAAREEGPEERAAADADRNPFEPSEPDPSPSRLTPAQRAVLMAEKKARKAEEKIARARHRQRRKVERLMEKAARSEADRVRTEKVRKQEKARRDAKRDARAHKPPSPPAGGGPAERTQE